jgi:hypothetical protein
MVVKVYDIIWINVSLIKIMTNFLLSFLVVFKNIIVPTHILHEWP